jgi:hypothetical protein
MALAVRKFAPPPVPRPPRLLPTWTTCMWIAFGVVVVIATVIGLYHAGTHGSL